jgi:5-methylcytosine-specific restriction endonuclease McrA
VRSLARPAVADDELLERLSRSRSQKAVAVSPRRADIGARYQTYRDHQGNPWSVVKDDSFAALRSSFHDLYKKPPACLDFIASLRQSVAGACPVCGRDALGTLDHYLPKADYAEYSFFSLNLVPACDRCNNTRNNLARGDQVGQRPVHPYFDAFVDRRVMTMRAEPDWRAPRLTPVPFEVQGEERTVVQWHIDHVIRRAGFDDYVGDLWCIVRDNPDVFLGRTATVEAVREKLAELATIEEVSGRSRNAWRSCFYHGLSKDDAALEFLATLVRPVEPAGGAAVARVAVGK